jgi:hypothetical protein
VATSNKLLVIQTEDGVVGVQKLWMEDDLDPVGAPVEQLDAPDLVEDRVAGVVRHVVSDDRRKRVSLESKDSALEENLVLV